MIRKLLFSVLFSIGVFSYSNEAKSFVGIGVDLGDEALNLRIPIRVGEKLMFEPILGLNNGFTNTELTSGMLLLFTTEFSDASAKKGIKPVSYVGPYYVGYQSFSRTEIGVAFGGEHFIQSSIQKEYNRFSLGVEGRVGYDLNADVPSIYGLFIGRYYFGTIGIQVQTSDKLKIKRRRRR